MGPSWSSLGLLAAWRSSPRSKSPTGTGLHRQPRCGEHAPKHHIKALFSNQESQGRVLNVTQRAAQQCRHDAYLPLHHCLARKAETTYVSTPVGTGEPLKVTSAPPNPRSQGQKLVPQGLSFADEVS